MHILENNNWDMVIYMILGEKLGIMHMKFDLFSILLVDCCSNLDQSPTHEDVTTGGTYHISTTTICLHNPVLSEPDILNILN